MIDVDKMIMGAMKSDDEVALRTARSLKSEILKYKTSKGAKPYSDEIEQSIIRKMCKQREDSISQYNEAGRFDLVLDEQVELNLLKKFLPEPVKESEICDWLLSYCLQKSWTVPNEPSVKIAIPKKSMGLVIKDTKLAFPTADGKMISDIVKENLI